MGLRGRGALKGVETAGGGKVICGDRKAASFLLGPLKEEVGLVAGALGEVENLAATFENIHAVLADAEHQQVTEKSVKLWLLKLKDTTYQIEDVLDEWHSRILKSQINRSDNAGSSRKEKVSYFLLSPCLFFNNVNLHRDIGHRMKDLRKRLDMIATEKDKYALKSVTRVKDHMVRLGSISIINQYEICGRDQDKKTIIKELLCERNQGKMGVSVISIVGMGGLGKTALAQLVFNDDEVNQHFEKKIWVCVSDPFDVTKLIKKIIEGMGGSVDPNVSQLETLVQHLRKYMEGKMILLVLDDVWTENKESWDLIKCCLELCVHGSRVIVTTRNEVVAVTVDSTYKHHLAILSDDDCWSLFKRLAFVGRKDSDLPWLESIGKQLSVKCKGVPLLAKILGCLMLHKKSEQDWLDVLANDLWELAKVNESILPQLLLSYNALPLHLRRCFTYCAVFEKGYQLRKDILVKQWMSQGFIMPSRTRDMESVGGEYFDNLVQRSFFQVMGIDHDINIFKMHDLMHDFANFISDNECSITESINNKFDYSKPRHLSLHADKSNPIPSSICKAKHLRTLLIGVGFPRPVLESKSLRHLKCLRTLDLTNVALETVPIAMRNLIHLRYLDLSATDLVELPATVCNFRNLQTLRLN